MTAKEIVERVRRCNDVLPGVTSLAAHLKSDIAHLLAIHAAVLELFEAERVWAGRDLKDDIWDATFRLEIAKDRLATLCGYEPKDT